MYYYDVKILARAARWLGKDDDAVHFERLAQDIREAFNRTFLNPETNQYATGSQTSNAMPLFLNLVPEDRISAVLENLVNDIRARGNHTTAGDVGHQFVLQALAKYNRSDVVGEMAVQTDFPSYGYQVTHGATTLTETWDGPTRGFSQNHFMLGHIEEWFYRSLGGIDFDPLEPAFKRIRIKPHPVADVTWARTEYRSMYGWIRCAWKIEKDVMTLEVEIPPDTRAEIYLRAEDPSLVKESGVSAQEAIGRKSQKESGYTVFEVGSGVYHFQSPISQRRESLE